jgi:DNA-binding NarL/FixJ family response regulator
LITLIDDQPDMVVVAEAGTPAEAIQAVAQHSPDVVLMDIRMPGEGGIEATSEISRRFPETKVIILTSFGDEALVLRAIRAGAAGYVLKQVGNQDLLRAITAVAHGEAMLDASITAKLINHVRESERMADEDAFRSLSVREMDVLQELVQGKTNCEIGALLNLTEKTVRNYVSSILEKLNISNRIELATFAVAHHLSDRNLGGE